MGNRRFVVLMRCSSQAFGSAPSLVAFDAFGVKRSNYSRFHTFFQQKSRRAGYNCVAVQPLL